MHSFLLPMLKGMIALYAITGLGKIALRVARIRNLPWYWNIAFTALAGQAIANVVVQSVLLTGAGSAGHLRAVAWILVGIATAGHLFSSLRSSGKIPVELFRAGKIITAILLLAFLTNFVLALAPSTKSDELYYHMLTPKRVVEDGGLQFYLLPVESSIVPHMQYQITLSVALVSGAPDAGNVLSWGYSVVLILFMIGFLVDAISNYKLALLCGALCCVGGYATIWHTASGPHALGDLAIVVAFAALLRPAPLLDSLGPTRYAFFLLIAAALAASTKLSLLPLSLVATALVAFHAIRRRPPGSKIVSTIGAAFIPWIVIHLPLMIWTYRASGSFWGPVLANVFGRSIYPEGILQYARDLQAFSPELFSRMARNAVIEFSPVFLISFLWVLWTAFRGRKTSQLIACLLVLQGGLVAWKLHFDFRFMGGLEYVAVLAAFLTLANREGGPKDSNGWSPLGQRVATSRNWILLFACVPWLASQIYYARPFAGVVSGFVPRSQFMERSVALIRDFETLDRLLPKGAVLYLSGGRWPNFYAPRPVVVTPLDLHGRSPVFRLAGSDEINDEQIDEKTSLKCGQVIYSNEQAVLVTSLIPGRVPYIRPIKVQSCQIESARSGPLP